MPAPRNNNKRQNRKAYRSLRVIKFKTHKAVKMGLNEFQDELNYDVRQGFINGKKSGRWYKYKGERIRASAINQYPAIRSGNLYRDTTAKIKDAMTIWFGNPTVKYAKYLVGGGRDYLKMSIDAVMPRFIRRTQRKIAKELLKETF